MKKFVVACASFAVLLGLSPSVANADKLPFAPAVCLSYRNVLPIHAVFPFVNGGIVFRDLDGGSALDVAEGFQGITVELYEESPAGSGVPGSDPVRRVNTDIFGRYSFGKLAKGNYFVKVQAPNPDEYYHPKNADVRFSFVTPKARGVASCNSHVDTSSGFSPLIQLKHGGMWPQLNAGIRAQGIVRTQYVTADGEIVKAELDRSVVVYPDAGGKARGTITPDVTLGYSVPPHYHIAPDAETSKTWELQWSNGSPANSTLYAELNFIVEGDLVTVNFVDYDGTLIDSQTVPYGKAGSSPKHPVREGFVFRSWDVDFSKVIGELTVTAIYDPVPTPTGTPTPAPEVSPTPTPTLSPKPSPSPTLTQVPAPFVRPTPISTPTKSPKPVKTQQPLPSTPMPTPTATLPPASPTLEPQPKPSVIVSPTPTPAPTPTATQVAPPANSANSVTNTKYTPPTEEENSQGAISFASGGLWNDPGQGGSGGVLALLNIFSAVAAVLWVPILLRKRLKDSGGSLIDIMKDRLFGSLVMFSIAVALIGIGVFFFTEDIAGSVQIVDRWTPLMGVICTVQMLVAMYARNQSNNANKWRSTKEWLTNPVTG